MRTGGLALDNHMLYTIFIDAPPAEYEVEAWNLASCDTIGREEIIKAVRERHHRVSGNRKKGSSSRHALYAGDVPVAATGKWRPRQRNRRTSGKARTRW